MGVVVLDSTNHVIRYFSSREEAECFRVINHRPDWKIVSYHKADTNSTEKQKQAIYFTEQILNIKFEGNINSKKECTKFLSQYLEQAKQFYIELKSEYESDRGY